MGDHAGDVFRIKYITEGSEKLPFLMQNENGPCPLLAITNILLLKRKIRIHPDLAFIDFRYLIQLVGNFLLTS
ncbi:hypothetical protein T484DRAFT_1802684 [Baffinella frigidus]|nr:hypothetical protein T484DRAFT_1802684 [Cryptophyta sp. CCMP2293]